MHLKKSTAKWRPFCLGFNELNLIFLAKVLVKELPDDEQLQNHNCPVSVSQIYESKGMAMDIPVIVVIIME